MEKQHQQVDLKLAYRVHERMKLVTTTTSRMMFKSQLHEIEKRES
jgi:hypothetical protein